MKLPKSGRTPDSLKKVQGILTLPHFGILWLHVRKDGQRVTSAQVYAVVMRHPDTFVKAEGRIMLLI